MDKDLLAPVTENYYICSLTYVLDLVCFSNVVCREKDWYTKGYVIVLESSFDIRYV